MMNSDNGRKYLGCYENGNVAPDTVEKPLCLNPKWEKLWDTKQKDK